MENINKRIINGIKDHCENENYCQFIKALIIQEANNSGKWWWKDTYKQIIEQYCDNEV